VHFPVLGKCLQSKPRKCGKTEENLWKFCGFSKVFIDRKQKKDDNVFICDFFAVYNP
jgi:hypothetical protein